LSEAASKAGKKDPHVAVSGERAGRLWAEGQTDKAIRVEQFFNELAQSHNIDILCPYPFAARTGRRTSVKEHLCGAHRSQFPVKDRVVSHDIEK
jgi:hypothetical protein